MLPHARREGTPRITEIEPKNKKLASLREASSNLSSSTSNLSSNHERIASMYAPRRYSELEAQGAEDIYNPHHLEYWLRQRGLGRFADRLHDFGVDTLHDLHDSDIISDVELRSEIGMNDSEIRKFRKACQTNRSVDWSHLNKKATEAVRRKTQVMQAEKHEGYVSSSKKACKFSIILAISASIALLCGQCDAHRLSSPHDDPHRS